MARDYPWHLKDFESNSETFQIYFDLWPLIIFFLFPNVEVGRMRASGREECRLLEQRENKLDVLKP